MFVVFLKFGPNKANAGKLMDGHKAWLQQGFDDGVFLVVGSLKPEAGGGIVAYNTTMEELERRVNLDPFVAEKVVTAEIWEIDPARSDARLDFLAA